MLNQQPLMVAMPIGVVVLAITGAPRAAPGHVMPRSPHRVHASAVAAIAARTGYTADHAGRTLRLRVTPRRVGPHGRIALRGRTVTMPQAGVRLKIQAWDGRRWRMFNLVRTRRVGRFVSHYRFAGAPPGRTFLFRVAFQSPGDPFTSAVSSVRRVTIR